MRQSPSSSRKRSRTIVRSVGSAPVTRLLLGEVVEQVARRELVEHVVVAQLLLRRVARADAAAGRVLAELARELAQRAAQLDRPAGALALPERDLARLARRGRDEHPVVRDLLDAPGAGAEQDHLPSRAS